MNLRPAICHLTSGHHPNDDRIYFKEIRSLAKRYADISLVSPFPEDIPGGERSVRFIPILKGMGAKGRWDSIRRLVRQGAQCRPDLVHCHEPESLAAAVRLKRQIGCKVLFDSHEYWPGVVAGKFPPPVRLAVRALYAAWERAQVKRCDAAVGVSGPITERLAAILGPDQSATVLNVPAAEIFGESANRTWTEPTVFCHDGFLTFDRGLRTLAEAVRLLSKSHAVRFKIIGDVFDRERAWLEDFIRAHGLQNVIVRTGWVKYECVGTEMKDCHIGLLAFSRSANHEMALPNKIFNYLLYGIPFVGPAFIRPLQEMERVDGCCRLVPEQTPEAYARIMGDMVERREATIAMGRRALEASRTKYRWEHMEPILFRLYDTVLGGVQRPERG